MNAATLTDRQKEIISTAFTEWGRINFSHMSLSPIAERLGLTKSALYRHFRNKDALVAAMKEVFLHDYEGMHGDFRRAAEWLTGGAAGAREAVRLFVRDHYLFFLNHPYYYIFFLARILRPPMRDSGRKNRILQEQTDLFRRLLAAEGRHPGDEELFTRLHFLYISSVHAAARVFIDCRTGYSPVPDLSEERFRREVDRAARFCLQGFMGAGVPDDLDYRGLENSCSVPREEMPPPDRIFSAVEAVVSREGLRNASVDKIAAQVGVSKSSLYFYFKNKDDLFRRMLEREKEYVTRIYADRFEHLPGFAERSYCCMVKTATYTRNNPALLTFFDWLRFQNIAPAVKAPDPSLTREMHSFILTARDRGEIDGDDDELMSVGPLLYVAAFRIVMENPGLGWAETARRLRVFHRLCLGGVFVKNLFPPEGI